MACAAALELGDPFFFFHSDHLIYGFGGFLFWKAVSFVMPAVRALPILQLFTTLLSAIAMAAIFRLLVRRAVAPIVALTAVVAVSGMAVVWVWSIEAQVYALALVGLAFGTADLIAPGGRQSPVRVGAWHAVAVLGHVMNLLWVVPAAYWFLGAPDTGATPKQRRSAFLRYLLTMASIVALCYLVVFLGVIDHRPRPWASAVLWLKGSAGLGPGRAFRWHFPGWTGPLQWLHTTAMFFTGAAWPYGRGAASAFSTAVGWLSLACSACILLLGAMRMERALLRFVLIWTAVYAVFLWTWEPSTECYRLVDAVPVAILFGSGLAGFGRSWRGASVGGLVAFLLIASNYGTRIAAMGDPAQNRLYEQTLRLAGLTPTNAIYLTEGGRPWLYLLYFTGRSAYSLSSPSGRAMLGRLRDGASGPPILIASSLLRDDALGPEIAALDWRPLASDLPWLVLQ